MSRFIIIANWKSNPQSVKDALALARSVERHIASIRNGEVVIAPPFPFLAALGGLLKKSKLGAQNTFWEKSGPFTGEVSIGQLKSLGVQYVIAGHSERRIYLGETDEMINKKVKALLENDIIPILCVGERERVGDDIPAIVGEQLKNALEGIKKNLIKNCIVAYEPIWAISTMPGAKPDTPDNAFRAMLYIKKMLVELYGRASAEEVRVIYGGSVRSDNIISFLREGKMEGALVGGASLRATEFTEIVKRAALVSRLR